ncbi:MAG: cryptochrome/photolyase family protein [Endozoicomonas sp.]|uniref:cryptochrome/photolyase family protein n=1 Tax=Endozoicomonas sp. TaxID=1892382 RepID=UPI003D9BD3D5
MKTYKTLRLILGDQLHAGHSWFRQKDPDTLYLVAELHQEASYVQHHVQKICAFFAAMEAFASALEKSGHEVLHLTLDETAQYKDLPTLLQSLIHTHKIKQFEYQRPDEYRLLKQLQGIEPGVPVTEVDTEHFLLPFDEISSLFKKGKATRMEHFYRKMRKRFDILMDGDQPEGGQWNFDHENRNRFKAKDLADIPEPLTFSNPVTAILERLGVCRT